MFYLRWLSLALVMILLFPFQVLASDSSLNLHSEAVILLDAKSGQVLYEKNSKVKMYPASITKIITGIMAIESGRLDEEATTSKRARWAEGTRIYLAQDEKKPLHDLVYGLMMNSGNDAAIVIAEHLGGTVENFAEQMNAFVNEKIGNNESNFVNPHGLFAENHYTTAYDMAMIARYAMKNPMFREIVSTKRRVWHGAEWESHLVNHNKLLWRYDGATGIKNGYVTQSGNTLVSSATRGGMDLIVVALKAQGSEKVYADTIQLFDYAFEQFDTRRLFSKGKRWVAEDGKAWEAIEDVFLTVKKGDSISYKVQDNGDVLAATGGKKQMITGKLVGIEDKMAESTLSLGPKEEARSVEESSERSSQLFLLGITGLLFFILAGAWMWWRKASDKSKKAS
ncbi:D-alanyl-D-alanine carboxypeptidase family protein [Ammoniphilus sp. YIM 78166]|uniref:D-alanyl-D-alanine carboxypeptidase family protein n=1 Tax=Ammoniphilus sp. YIM 78166 TaxID=1644106 RepID=UPI00106F634C|nr:D-alanyl-D-alanine carboxypeptidase family protein [Ammoniphilus sp. YIM 78166]